MNQRWNNIKSGIKCLGDYEEEMKLLGNSELEVNLVENYEARMKRVGLCSRDESCRNWNYESGTWSM
jgi:hypothetical protein